MRSARVLSLPITGTRCISASSVFLSEKIESILGLTFTTHSSNLTPSMRKLYKVSLGFTDAQGSIDTLLNVKPKDTLYNFLIEGVKFEECVVNVRPNIDSIFSDKKTELAEMHLVPVIGRERTLAERMEGIDHYDICFV